MNIVDISLLVVAVVYIFTAEIIIMNELFDIDVEKILRIVTLIISSVWLLHFIRKIIHKIRYKKYLQHMTEKDKQNEISDKYIKVGQKINKTFGIMMLMEICFMVGIYAGIIVNIIKS